MSLRMAFNETAHGKLMNALHERTIQAVSTYAEEIRTLKARLNEAPTRESMQKEVEALRAMLKTCNAELEEAKGDAQAVRDAFTQTDQGAMLAKARKEIQALHGVVAVLITEIKDPVLLANIVGTMTKEGIPAAAAQALQSAAKRAKKNMPRGK